MLRSTRNDFGQPRFGFFFALTDRAETAEIEGRSQRQRRVVGGGERPQAGLGLLPLLKLKQRHARVQASLCKIRGVFERMKRPMQGAGVVLFVEENAAQTRRRANQSGIEFERPQ